MKKHLILLSLILLLLAIPAFAQDASILSGDNYTCELGSLEVDNVFIKAKERKEKITVLFYQGEKEKKKKNLKRLETIKETLLCMNRWDSLVEYGMEFKVAEEISEKPKVEFYVGNELYFTFYPNPKRLGFCTYCCYEPKEVKQILKNCRKARTNLQRKP